MNYIKSPFNFVPLNENVFYPEWANRVYHDIPFRDGESGSIDIKITAKTPIYVRNGHNKNEALTEDENYLSFSNVDNKFFIPGTSIKGMLRNTVKILSFGKMDNIADTRYSLRDLRLQSYMDYFKNNQIQCGWLLKSGDRYVIEGHGTPCRISHSQLDELLKTNFVDIYSKKQFKGKNAIDKIKIINKVPVDYPINISYDESLLNPENNVDLRVKCVNINSGKLIGKIVVTGQSSYRKEKTNDCKATGKFFEFVFPDKPNGQTYQFNDDDQLFKDFLFIHNDSEDWKYWKGILNRGGCVPIFYYSLNGYLKHFGLAYLYKLPYKYRTKSFLPDKHNGLKQDLANIIFGYIGDTSLKGRVMITSAFAGNNICDMDKVSLYLASPKASYYPIYLQQKGEEGTITGRPITMMDKDAILKGWKKYPIRENIGHQLEIPTGQEKNCCKFNPLSPGVEFSGKILIHNLKKEEIGVLVKAIQFPEFHSIGLGKPFGYGKVKFDILNHSLKNDLSYYEKEFNDLMSKNFPDYNKSPQLKEFKLMSSNQDLIEKLEYMHLEDFAVAKKESKYLLLYSELIKEKAIVVPEKEYEAIVTYFERSLRKAKLIYHKDTQSKVLEINDSKLKLKIGDSIIVKLIGFGGRVDRLIYVRKHN